jgi:hypothetical protein
MTVQNVQNGNRNTFSRYILARNGERRKLKP